MITNSFPFGFLFNGYFLPFHFFFEILAFYLGISYYYSLRKKQKDHFSESQRLLLVLSACIGALIGSRLLAIIEHYPLLFSDPSWLFMLQSKTIVGGIIGGWIAIEITKKRVGITESSGDLFTFPLLLAIAVGRIGCALTGVSDSTAGIPSNLPWAYDQGDGISRHPTAIYEIVFLLLLWGALLGIRKKFRLQNGDIFKFFMVGYLFWRFIVEFIKPVIPLFLGLSAIQIACALALFYCAHFFSKRIFSTV